MKNSSLQHVIFYTCVWYIIQYILTFSRIIFLKYSAFFTYIQSFYGFTMAWFFGVPLKSMETVVFTAECSPHCECRRHQ